MQKIFYRMFKGNSRQFDSKAIVLNIFLILMISYFVYHSFNGQRGLFAYLSLKKELSEKNLELQKLKDERIALEHKVQLINPRTLDLDMLDEIARNSMGLISSDEKVIILNKEEFK